MKLGIALATLALVVAPGLSFAQGCDHGKQAMSCAEGTVYDSVSGSCVVDATT